VGVNAQFSLVRISSEKFVEPNFPCGSTPLHLYGSTHKHLYTTIENMMQNNWERQQMEGKVWVHLEESMKKHKIGMAHIIEVILSTYTRLT
jgi:hypothetical protein